MRITDALRGEHGVLAALLAAVSASAEHWSPDSCATAGALLTAALGGHARLEDELLFTALTDVFGDGGGPLACLRTEHDEIESTLAALATGDLAAARRLPSLARAHFAKEEEVLFPLAERHLDAALLTELGTQWASRRGVVVRGP